MDIGEDELWSMEAVKIEPHMENRLVLASDGGSVTRVVDTDL